MSIMKTKLITNLKKKVLLVDQFDSYDEVVDGLSDNPMLRNFKRLCTLKDLTEDQARELVYSYKTMLIGSDIMYYRNYVTKGGMDTATQSFQSALQAEQVFMTLPVAKVPNKEYSEGELLEILEQAEQTVFSPNTLIFVES